MMNVFFDYYTTDEVKVPFNKHGLPEVGHVDPITKTEVLGLFQRSGTRGRRAVNRTYILAKCGGTCESSTIEILPQNWRRGKRLCVSCVANSGIHKKEPYEHLYVRLQNTCERREKELGITLSQFQEFCESAQNARCHYCHEPLIYLRHSKTDNKGRYMRVNMDRVDNEKGYVLDNIVPCCKVCNLSRNCYHSSSEWFRLLEPVRLAGGWKNWRNMHE
jgi:hypothetical protein